MTNKLTKVSSSRMKVDLMRVCNFGNRFVVFDCWLKPGYRSYLTSGRIGKSTVLVPKFTCYMKTPLLQNLPT